MGCAVQAVDIGMGGAPMRMHDIKFTFGDHAPDEILESPNAQKDYKCKYGNFMKCNTPAFGRPFSRKDV